MSPQAAARISRAKKTAALPISLARPASGWISMPMRSTTASMAELRISTSKSRSTEMTRSAFSGRVTGKKCRGDEDHGQKELFTEGRFVLKTRADSFDRIACGVDEASQSSFAFQGLGGGCGLLRLGHIEVPKGNHQDDKGAPEDPQRIFCAPLRSSSQHRQQPLRGRADEACRRRKARRSFRAESA